MILSDLGSPDAVLERRPGTIGRGMLGPFGTVLGAPGVGFGAAVGASGSVWGCLGGVCGRLEATLAPPGGDSEMYIFRRGTGDFGASGGPERVLEGS